MNDDFNKLKDIGAQKIHEATHIARVHIEDFLHKNFDAMNKIQFMGFVSILEREYSVDLSELKSEASEYYETKPPKKKKEDGVKVFVAKKKRNLVPLYLAIVLIIFVVFVTSTFKDTNNSASVVDKVDNTLIESAKNNITVTIKENNETNITKAEPEKPIEKTDGSEIISFKIIPEHELWLGYIDLSTFEKDQKLFSDELSLDPNKDWLLTLGHGYISIEINGIIKKFTNPKTARFSYINKELKELSFKEFKSLNRGNEW